MNEPKPIESETQGGSCAPASGSASWSILRQVLDDGAFEGAELAAFGEYTVSWDTVRGIVAIADSGGWWTMDARQLKAIAAATPNEQAHRLPPETVVACKQNSPNNQQQSTDQRGGSSLQRRG